MIIQSTRVWVNGEFSPLALTIEKNKITEIRPYGENTADLDFGDKRILPGFIDIHTHGAYGYDTNDGTPEGLREWVKRVSAEEGVTAILPTTVTQDAKALKAAVANVAQVMAEEYEGAEILGIHFEGPFLDMEYKGAQPPEAILKPSVERFREFEEAARGHIRYITLAPEHDENHELIRYLVKQGIIVSMGHSAATYEEGIAAMKDGAKSMTHVYNGMSPYHHRKLGLVGLALTEPAFFGEIIADGHHSHPAALKHLYDSKDKDHSIMITDSLRVKGCPRDGYYELGGHQITLGADGLARLAGTDTIAGSTLKMNDGLRILIEEANVSLEAAINSCTKNPASCMGVANRKGMLAQGYDADIIVLEEDYNIHAVWCLGKREK